MPKYKPEAIAPLILTKRDLKTHVQYFKEGWRVGTVVEIKARKGVVRIAPMAGYKGKQPRAVTVPISDIKRID